MKRLNLIIPVVALVLMLFAVACSYGPAVTATPTPNQEYTSLILRAVERQSLDREECAKTLDQPCLTRSVERLREAVGIGVPSSVSWMSDAHQRLYSAVSDLARINKLSENPENLTPAFLQSARAAAEELQAAADDWSRQAQR